ncbi:MAG TPA: hypothetical protein VGN57_01820 [Pirellulaceae bacterium]|jgi:hypothetical protein|nr:hypothetical protein [Pirellulaceae bacterium]
MRQITRRDWLRYSALLAGAGMTVPLRSPLLAAADEPAAAQGVLRSEGVEVLSPRDRVPLSFIIDDSTCLVNMGHFCTPQFQACYPDRAEYQKDWRSWPREIPDAFVREFGEWCAEHGVKGKYSVVPNPACVGWLDRDLPGWSRNGLQESLKLVRELMLPNWDIHPEMITHTRVIDLKTGRPFEEISPATMENSYPRQPKSADELAEYLAYALRILKNCDLPCEGVTTPGGFGNLIKSELSLAVQQAVRDVYATEIPHYFKYVIDGDESTEPKLEHVSGVGTDDLRLTVNVPAGTGDWFGGWQGDTPSQPDLYANEDATSGRMVELIERGQPALMLCHWPGIYSNGTKEGLHSFQRVVLSLHRRFADRTVWMKLSEMARYWAAKELTSIVRGSEGIAIDAPFACPGFTIRIAGPRTASPRLTAGDAVLELKEASEPRSLDTGRWIRAEEGTVVCFDLPKGKSKLRL